PLRESAGRARKILESAARLATDSGAPVPARVAAARLLGYLPFDRAGEVYEKLLGNRHPIEVQSATIEAMSTRNNPRSAPILFERWSELGPSVRQEALNLLYRRTDTTTALLRQMKDGKINKALVDLERRWQLTRKRTGAARVESYRLAVELFGETSPDRREVLKKYKPALGLTGDPSAGREAFKKVCITCHRIGGEGFEVGPDITDVHSKSRETLLSDILDPNRAVDPRWINYALVTVDGRVTNGLILRETSEVVVLGRGDGEEEVLTRAEIRELRSSGLSLMPEGVENDLSLEDMADLLAFLKQQE
ncbi:MAG: c-type cytochrome, partial [Gammaproteobacteria bacterium]|nr:c-type cytochrome [Gammaproteobacteria bacterium]